MHRDLNQDRRGFLAAAAGTLVGMELAMIGSTRAWLRTGGAALGDPLSALGSATAWLNSPPLTAAGLRGKVVLVEFLTYTCINWLRQLPYVRAWDGKYREHGLVVIGVHTPEFGFESDLGNVRRAARELRVEYPIAVDNDYAIWRAFENRYWPALYFVDTGGAIRHRKFGEGAYGDSERTIQRLLAAAGANAVGQAIVTVDARGIEAAADWDSLASPETYLGSERTDRFVSTRGAATASGHLYAVPRRVRLNEWALAGDWTVGRQAVTLNRPNGRIACRFRARDLHMVLGPSTPAASVRCRVSLDGRPPGTARGIDVDAQGHGVVTEQRLYQLIRQPRPITDHHFEIEFLDAGVEAYVFTFG